MVDSTSILSVFPNIGNGISWLIERITDWTSSTLGVEVVPFQSKLIAIMILVFVVYLIASVINFGIEIGKKIIKWGLIVIFVIFIISVISSMFV